MSNNKQRFFKHWYQRFFKYWEENKPKDYKGNFISFKDFKNDMEKFLNIK
jgi:hypothetical protein